MRKNYTGTVITVTQRDINKGCAQDYVGCPIARAVKRTTGRLVEICNSADVVYGDERVTYRLPKRALNFIHDFDTYGTVKPFTFKLGRQVAG